MASSLPDKMRAIVIHSTSGPASVETVPTPQPFHGSAVVKVLSVGVISYTRDVYNGKRKYSFPAPLIGGYSAIGRVVAVGPDSTKVKPSELVFVDCTVRARDSDDVFLAGIAEGNTEGSKKLMRDVWRDWTLAEYCRAPLENLTVLNEHLLTSSRDGRGYTLNQLNYASQLLVPYGGLRDINLQAGETVIVAPATGQFGAAAVFVALGMGAKVVAFGRNTDALADLKARVPLSERVEAVPITGDEAADLAALRKAANGSADAFFDIGPPEAAGSTHIKSAILALRHSGRVSLMGGYLQDVAIPHRYIMRFNIRLHGCWMYSKSDVRDLFKMIEAGLLDLNAMQMVGEYQLEDFEVAWDVAAENARFGQQVVMTP